MSHEFGNIDAWTKDKLERVARYLDAYLVALKNQNFHLEYIDAFAGSGYVTRKRVTMRGETLFDINEDVLLKDLIDGSARIALQTEPPFEKYTFIEKQNERCNELENLKGEFPQLASRIEVIHGEANAEVQKLCLEDWIGQRRRGVMFLDPYGTQVTWETIKAIADTKAIDLWILLPIGTINRLLNRDGRIQPGRKRRLDTLFGDDQWFEILYEITERNSLFSQTPSTVIKKTAAPFGFITKYFIERLQTVFAEVAENPFVMKNSTNSPIFLLGFAAGNPTGAPIAVKIAQHILGKK